jgi:hypothetical protein
MKGAEHFRDNKTERLLGFFVVGTIALIWSLLVNGAVPFVMLPALGQPAVMLGYAQDFANQPWYAIYAHSFGYPAPTGLATGLPLAYVASVLLRVGVSHTAAYSGSMVFWLGLGYWGAWRLASLLGGRGVLPALAAATWMSLPMVWVHTAYSSLGLGMALLPTYFYSAVTLLETSSLGTHCGASIAYWLRFALFCVVALFMDGYTYVMFAMVTVLAGGAHFVQEKNSRVRHLLRFALKVGTGFAGSFLLYRWYMGVGNYAVEPMDFYRGWGLDLSFLLQPTLGWSWAGDALGMSVQRSEVTSWGDMSVWTATFALPLAAAGICCAIWLWRRDRRAQLLVLIALVGLYFSLGPTLKFYSIKPPGMATEQMMAAQYGWFSTKNAWFYAHLPGLKNMRASYRWEAVFLLGMWALLALGSGHAGPRLRKFLGGVYLLLIVLLVPTPRAMFSDYRVFLQGLNEIDKSLVASLSSSLKEGERVLFLPIGNDALVNYLSPRLRIRSYNTGGDKQLALTSEQWPSQIQYFLRTGLSVRDLPALRHVLFDGEVDAVVMPYFDMSRSAYMWPCAGNRHDFSVRELQWLSWPRYACPKEFRAKYRTIVDALKLDGRFFVQDTELYAVIRLRKSGPNEQAMVDLAERIHFPMNVVADEGAEWILGAGWHDKEPTRRWSNKHASLTVPIPHSCRYGQCKFVMRFLAFGASTQRPISVLFSPSVKDAATQAHETQAHEIVVADGGEHEVVMSLPARATYAEFLIDVPQALSPFALDGSPDHRTLGISLHSVNVVREDAHHPAQFN